MTIRPDGKLYVQSGVGNLGTHSLFDLARVAAEAAGRSLGDVSRSRGAAPSRHLPYSCLSVGSQTTHAMTRANHAAAMDARRKLQEIAARDLGGGPDDYEIGGERVFRRGSPGRGLTYARAASRAIALGGRYDGHELPENIHQHTKAAAAGARRPGTDGRGEGHLSAQRHDVFVRRRVCRGGSGPRDRQSRRSSTFSAWRDAGTVINPRSLGAQIDGGSCLGIGHALCQKWVYDPQYGVPLAKRFYHTKPLTILDIPASLQSGGRRAPRSGDAGRRTRHR